MPEPPMNKLDAILCDALIKNVLGGWDVKLSDPPSCPKCGTKIDKAVGFEAHPTFLVAKCPGCNMTCCLTVAQKGDGS